TQGRDLLLREFRRQARIEHAIPAGIAVDQREVLQPIDVVGRVGVAEEIVKKGPQPGVAGAGIGSEPQDLAHAQASRGWTAASPRATATRTGCQSPMRVWRNSRRFGYQGESERSSIHRQSGTVGSMTQPGTLRAPAMCTVELSIEMTRSIAAV